MLPVRELDVAGKLGDGDDTLQVRPISQQDFLNVLKKIKPVVSDEELQKFTEWTDEYGG